MVMRCKVQRTSIVLSAIGIVIFYLCIHSLEQQMSDEKAKKVKELNLEVDHRAPPLIQTTSQTNNKNHASDPKTVPDEKSQILQLSKKDLYRNSNTQKVTTTPSLQLPKDEVRPSKSLITGGEDPDPEIRNRRNFIKSMMKDAWSEYVKYAWGENELAPISRTGRHGDIYGNSKIGATIIDSLDTLYIMGFMDEYKKGRDWVKKSFHFKKLNQYVSLFETNIRILGGFLSTFALTGDKLFVSKAHEVGKALLPAFDSRYGLPYSRVNPKTKAVSGIQSVLAELGSLQLEFVYLSKVTGDPQFENIIRRIQQHMHNMKKPKGLYGGSVNIEDGQFGDSYTTMGGGADSFYEYLIKDWVQNGNTLARKMYDEAVEAFLQNKLIRKSQSGLMYIGDLLSSGTITQTGSHLQCFAGGMFALGSVTDPRNGTQVARDMEIAESFTNTCHESYRTTATKIGPEAFRLTGSAKDVEPTNPSYILRPEVIESYFVLYRLTKDPKYREYAWEAAKAIQKYCKVGPHGGYSGIRNVDDPLSSKDNVQQTFFLAETLKYLYLIFSTPDLINLDYFVFNTEAHPLPIKGKHPSYPAV